MLMQMIDCLIEQDPSLSARRAIDVRRYIVNQWNRTHEESIDEDGVALFLCDEKCALFGGRAESLPHLGLSGRIWPDFRGASG